ncbi:G-type lectin S-receptor-like serine/threonine-protein kinase SD2-5 [Selaginella moellendorffii]|nr:G-type lectin S-receptor-like serine/threonine-protein kinase SD2-5 [Selaginella moellendorffii]|eukprot:XP_002978370.2 G-type lectin S-receptor-like serine/threonine-protein kinase SD2-5 [Selaginella moellendorffii]
MADPAPQRGTCSLAAIFLAILCTRASCQQQVLEQKQFPRVIPGDPRGLEGQAVEFDGYTAPNLSLLNVAQYSLAFVNHSSGLFTLAIVTNSSAGSLARIIWEANQDDPVSANATLGFEGDGGLALRDSGGRLVWTTGPLNGFSTTLELQETGNLTVRNIDNEVLWQSFGSPTDTLVLQQPLSPGMRLESRRSSTNSSSGTYSLVMEAGGLVLYSNFSGLQEPYWIRGYDGLETLAAATTNACESLTAALARNESSSALTFTFRCGSNETLIIPLQVAGENGSFIRLEADGNLQAYTLGSSGNWTESQKLFDQAGSCGLPERCQPFGICSNGSCVECLSATGTRVPWSNSCSAPVIDSCGNSSSLDFVSLPGIEHFSHRYLNGSSLSFQLCRSQCLQNCSCSAFFFWEESSSCFLMDSLRTLQAVPNHRHVAYVKVAATNTTNDVLPVPATGSKLSAGATAGIVVGSFFLLLVALLPIILCISRKRSKQVEAVVYDSDNYLETIENLKPMRFCRADLERITDNFSKLIGTGSFGSVYEGVLPEGRKVAVKRLESTGQGKRKIFAEVAVLGTFHHWNLVRLLGFCDQGCHGFIIYEHIGNGSLDRWIYRDNGENVLDWELRMGIVMGIARGLAYLHEECMEVHLNLKPQNVLLDSSFVPKLSGYGVSRIMARESQSSAAKTGLESYHPPEWLLDTSITEKCDVYSFGILLLEIISGKRSSNSDKFYLPAHALDLTRQGRQMELVDTRIVKDSSESKVRQGVSIAFQCLQEDPRSRPSMGDVVQMLQGSCEIPEVPRNSAFFWLKDNETRYSEAHSLLMGLKHSID